LHHPSPPLFPYTTLFRSCPAPRSWSIRKGVLHLGSRKSHAVRRREQEWPRSLVPADRTSRVTRPAASPAVQAPLLGPNLFWTPRLSRRFADLHPQPRT